MHIGGLQKHSLIDYPGKLGCVLFLTGCNFACPYCHNPQLVGPPGSRAAALSIEEVLLFLETRRGLIEGVVVSGGEPTLQPGLADACRRIKSMGYAIKLDTNGSRPKVIRRLAAEGLVDYLALDVKTEPERYPGSICRRCEAEAVIESIRLVMESGIDYEFRTTCVKPLVTPQTIEPIVRLLRGCRRYVLQPFRAGTILRPDFFGGIDPCASAEEMETLQKIAAPWVEQCILR
ncbi:MAG: anaerobic ribonucleoside-triphosphate reductase activating protein [Desulfobacterales bacterium]|jgi:pyruvate formate lyase activating enzyme|nr:anaerobic ribonucleoside-triphosphate reductase activating protein [Desulfobacterales bacterium]